MTKRSIGTRDFMDQETPWTKKPHGPRDLMDQETSWTKRIHGPRDLMEYFNHGCQVRNNS